MKHVVTKFNDEHFRKEVLNKIVIEQTKRLEKYAEQELSMMARTHAFKNRTYNLEDSLVWCVYYNGELRSYGFYGGKRASTVSYLHEYGRNPIPVDGRANADMFPQMYTPTVKNGWEIVWAATAPYSIYLEDGFTTRGGRFMQFEVISQRFDHIAKTFGNKGNVIFKIRY